MRKRHRGWRRALLAAALVLACAWLAATAVEFHFGVRLFPWSAYAGCGERAPAALPPAVRVGLYEEFPVPRRLAHLSQVDFPVALAVAARSRDEFLALRETISRTYPQVRALYFWPVLARDEGYYPSPLSDAAAVRRIAAEADGLPVLWDLEPPIDNRVRAPWDVWQTRAFLDDWLRARRAPVQLWRTKTSMGFDSRLLRALGLHYDPVDYPAVTLQLDLYTTGAGRPRAELTRILRCGVERYGARFVPALGVLDDGEGPPGIFVPPETLRRDLSLAREAGVSEVWLFGANGLSAEYLAALHQALPLEPLH